MKHLATAFTVLIACFASLKQGHGQTYKFRHFSTEDGITQPFIYGIEQDDKGYLWIATGEGLCRYDGFRFETFLVEDSLSENFVNCSYKDDQGTLWFGHKEGGISYYDGAGFIPVRDARMPGSTINDIASDPFGNIWFASQNDGLVRVDRNKRVTTFKNRFKGYLIYDIAFTKDGLLLVGTSDGLFFYMTSENEAPNLLFSVSELPLSKVQCIVYDEPTNAWWIGTEDEGLYVAEIGESPNFEVNARRFGENLGMSSLNVQYMLRDQSDNIWVCTFGDGLYRISPSNLTGEYDYVTIFNEENGLGSNYIKCLYEDREGNIWLGTYGGGLSNLLDDFFEFYQTDLENVENDVQSLWIDQSQQWLGLNQGLLKITNEGDRRYVFFNGSNGFVDDKVTAIHRDAQGTLWIGTSQHGLFYLEEETQQFVPFQLSEDLLSKSIRGIVNDNSHLWIATQFGVFTLNPTSENIFHLTIESGLKHNNINAIFKDSRDNIWIGTNSNYISIINGVKFEHYQITNAAEVVEVMALTEDQNGNIWVATSGNGVYQFSSATFKRFNNKDGLRSNYCYSIIDDLNGNVWVGHRGGLSRIDPETGKVRSYDKNSGISADANLNAIFEDPENNIWIGTSEGAIKYNPNKDLKNKVPPNTDLLAINVFDSAYAPSELIELPYDIYKIRFDFIGLSFNNSDLVTYQYKLEGHDLDWSDPSQENSATYPRIEDGEYTFKVRACNSDGICMEESTQLKLVVNSPFWKRWWFLVTIIAILWLVIYIYFRIRERRHRQVQQYLQEELDLRTHEVREKNAELERKNKDITDSITYAQRIQNAIIPELEKLRLVVPEAFIFFRPRDIVSGDFYWFRQFGDKLIIACADSTGHGVPGAFMSMIGSTMLQDLLNRPDVTSPQMVLEGLDHEVNTLLSQGDESAPDGMDITVCEIDIYTREVVIASAMRPVFVHSKGELQYVKGDRFPIGGGYSSYEKVFTETTIQLEEGDCIYLFTDGYPDQFGGRNQKKLKVSGMEEILVKVNASPMEKQGELIASSFDIWKGKEDQIDDVLVIGIRV